ncbi:MAG: hypothetical protein J1E39_09340 [Eubacterium sp.]|nr:hypothetical protein [Eubacterium sp.]
MNAKLKKIAIGSGALALTAAISVGGTLAYLSAVTEQRANNFTFASDGLDARLTEPKWDGIIDYEYPDDPSEDLIPVYDYIDDDDDPDTPDVPVYGYEDGDKSKPITDPEEVKDIEYPDRRPRYDSKDPDYNPKYGDEEAQNMVPGRVAPKDPFISNIGVTDEWIAAKITFVYAEGTPNAGQQLSDSDYILLCDIIDIDYDADKASGNSWVRPEGESAALKEQIFFYNKIVKGNNELSNTKVSDKTAPIFTKVTVSKDATTEQIKYFEDLGGFAIWIEGYAVQSEQFDTFDDWYAEGEPVFENTPSDTDVEKPGIHPSPNHVSE